MDTGGGKGCRTQAERHPLGQAGKVVAGSYRIQSVAASVESEVRRLKAQVELFWERELRCLQALGLRDGMKILECGCGPGHVMEKLLSSYPNSSVTGIDVDPVLVGASRERLAVLHGGRVRIEEQSILNMEFEDESFDFVIARLVLEHLPDPLSAVREVHRVLKTGGRAVFIDNDFEMHLMTCPDIPELHDLYDAYCRCRTAEGGNPRIGRELPGILQEGGFANVELEIVSAHNRLSGDDVFLRSEGSGIPTRLVKDGYLSREIMDRLARKWHSALQRNHHVLYRQLFLAAGQKAAPGGLAAPAPDRQEDSGTVPLDRIILHAESREDRCANLTTYLRALVGDVLKNGHGLPIDRPLIDLGMDSLRSVELANSVATDLGVTLSPVDILEAQSIVEIAARLDIELELREHKPGSVSPPVGIAAANAQTGPAANEWEEGSL